MGEKITSAGLLISNGIFLIVLGTESFGPIQTLLSILLGGISLGYGASMGWSWLKAKREREPRIHPFIEKAAIPHLIIGDSFRLERFSSLSGIWIRIEEDGHITVTDKALLVECLITIPSYPYESHITIEGTGVFMHNVIEEEEEANLPD